VSHRRGQSLDACDGGLRIEVRVRRFGSIHLPHTDEPARQGQTFRIQVIAVDVDGNKSSTDIPFIAERERRFPARVLDPRSMARVHPKE
jgi:hypothetical protein